MSTVSILRRTGGFVAVLAQLGWGSRAVHAQDLDVSVVPVYDEWEVSAGSTDAMLTFTFTNRGRTAVHLGFTCSATMGLECRDRDLGSATLPVGASEVIRAYLSAPQQETAGVVQVLASYHGQPMAEGAYSVHVTAPREPISSVPEVTPKGGTLRAPLASISEIDFQVRNRGAARASYQFTCTVAPPVEGGCEIEGERTVEPGEAEALPVRFTPDASTTYRVTVTASAESGTDAGWMTVTTTSVVEPGSGPTLTLDDANPGLEEDRHDCPTIPAGAGSIECDDYRYEFSLGSVRRMNRMRGLALSYNSGTTASSKVVGANLTLPTGVGVEGVNAALWANGELQDSVVLGSEVPLGVPVRLAFQVTRPPFSGDGVVRYRISATIRYTGVAIADTVSALGYYIQVDRGSGRSEFGEGWWLSGYEKLTPLNDPDLGDVLLWSDADGSARVYLPDGGAPGLWVAQTRGRPQTISTAAEPLADEARALDLSDFEWASTDGEPTTGLDGGSTVTWAFWVDAAMSPGEFAGLHDQSWLPRVWWFDITPAGLRVSLEAAGTGAISTALTPLPWDQWAFVIVQYDGAQESNQGRLRAWINGNEVAISFQGEVPSELRSDPQVALGLGRSSPSPGLVGKLGEVAILRTLLSQDERSDWYTRGIDFNHEGLVSGFEWRESLHDVGPAGNDLASRTIESEDGDFVATSAYPSRETPTGGWRKLVDMAAYHRPMSGGGEQLFDAAGRHIGAVDRNGNETRFEHSVIGTEARLTSILLPTPEGPKPAFEFQYDSATVALLAIRELDGGGGWQDYQVATSPTSAAFQIDAITAPDGLTTSFAYDTGSLSSVTDQRGAVTELTYDRGKVSEVRVLTPDDPTTDDVVMRYRPADLVGLDVDGPFAPMPTDSVSSVFDGPRADVEDITRYFVTGWGAIRGVKDAGWNETWIDRTDPHFPGLVTRAAYPNGRVVETSYDPATGLVVSYTDCADDVAVTRYEWDAQWERPTSIRSPEGLARHFAYDARTGDLDSTWVGTTVASFTYNERGLVLTSATGEGNLTTFAYDSLGNAVSQTSALGAETRYERDQVGRVLEILRPIAVGNETGERVETFRYDASGRPLLHRLANTVDDAMGWDSTSYDRHGDLALVYRGGTVSARAVEALDVSGQASLPDAPLPSLTWTHDQLGRVKTTSDDGASEDAFEYDLAGNLTRRLTASGDTIWMEYDNLNRLVRRRSNDRSYGPAREIEGAPADLLAWPFPYYPSSNGNLDVAGDEATFEYDEMGNLVRAVNRAGTVIREFTLRGELAKDGFSRATPSDESEPDLARAAIAFQYDRDGRLQHVDYPETTDGEPGAATYYYDQATGHLASVVDPLGYATSFRYDGAGRTNGVLHPGDLFESIEYDADGRLERINLGSLLSNSFVRDPADGVLEVVQNLPGGDKVQLERTYDGLGHVTGTTDFTASPVRADRFAMDGRGRVMLREAILSTWRADVRGAVVVSHHDPETGRLSEQSAVAPLDAAGPGNYPRILEVTYERGGAVSTVGSLGYRSNANGILHPPVWMTASAEHNYYDADGRLRFRQQFGVLREADPLRVERIFGAWEQYLYDGLGRRVVVRTISNGLCDSPNCFSAERSYAWGGDRIYFEESASIDGADHLEGQYGSVQYTYGPDGSHPVSVAKNEDSGVTHVVFPHLDWRGRVALATDSAGRRCDLGNRACAGALWPADLEDEFGAVAPDAPFGPWFGSLLDGQHGTTGLLYRDGQHYDPRLGMFVEPEMPGSDAKATCESDPSRPWFTEESWEGIATAARHCRVHVPEVR